MLATSFPRASTLSASGLTASSPKKALILSMIDIAILQAAFGCAVNRARNEFRPRKRTIRAGDRHAWGRRHAPGIAPTVSERQARGPQRVCPQARQEHRQPQRGRWSPKNNRAERMSRQRTFTPWSWRARAPWTGAPREREDFLQAPAVRGSLPFLMAEPVELKWLGTAGFQVRQGGHDLLLDPFLSRPQGAIPRLPTAWEDYDGVSLILVSHGHFDHAQDAARLALRSGARVCAPRRVCRALSRAGIAQDRLVENELVRTVAWHGATVEIVPSRHIVFDPRLVLRTCRLILRGGVFWSLLVRVARHPEGSSSEFLLRLGDHRILFSGSGGGDWCRLAALKPTCFLLPFSGRSDVVEYYMRALSVVRPQQVVLHHFDKFFPSFVVDYPVEEFRQRAGRDLPDMKVTVPEPGAWFTL